MSPSFFCSFRTIVFCLSAETFWIRWNAANAVVKSFEIFDCRGFRDGPFEEETIKRYVSTAANRYLVESIETKRVTYACCWF